MKNRLLQNLAIVIVIVGLLSFSGFKEVLAQVSPIKIGVIWDLTGPAGEEMRRASIGFNMAIEDVNAAGGLLGRPIKAVIRDSKAEAGGGAREARDLVYNEKVNFLAGSGVSSVSLAISEVAKETKTIYINNSSKSKKIQEDKGHRYVFSPTGNTRMTGGGQAYLRAQEPHTKYVLMCADYAWGRDMADDFEGTLLKYNPKAKVIEKLWPKFGEKDFSPYITALMSLKPEVVYGALIGSDLVSFIKQAKPYGLFKQISFSFLGTQPLFEAVGKDMPEGIYFDIEYYFTYPGEESVKFDKKFYNYSGFHADSQAYNGWTCATTLIEGIKKAGTIETEAVVNALEGISFMTPLGIKNTIRACDHLGSICNIVGKSKFVPEYPNWIILVDFKYPDPNKLMISCDEVRRIREAAK